MTIGAYIVAKNEDVFILECAKRLKGVDQVVLVDNGSNDKTLEIMKSIEGVEVYEYPVEECLDMGALRDFAISKLNTDFIWIVDADEFYEDGAVDKIRKAIEENPQAISFRTKYHQMAWRPGFKQANFVHLPDRIYRKDVLDQTSGVLPLDMVKVKKEFYTYRPYLEYDNQEDKSFENPIQPVLDVWYYHLARTRGYNFEYSKNVRYQKNMHPDWTEEECKRNAKINQWVSGLYDIEKIDVPANIPTQTIPNPKVSIIISNYNYSDWLNTAIVSCLNQTIPAYEIIVVDDCSTDDSREIIERYGVKKLYQAENKGVVQCRNWGMSECTGDFFILLDSDDYIEPTFIEKTLAKQKETKAQIISTDMRVFNAIDYYHTYPDFSIEELRKNQIIPSVCALVDRHVFELTGGFREDTVYDDYEFWLRCAVKHGFDFAQVHEPLFNYNRKPGSRIEELDKRQQEGFAQLNQEYGKII